MRLCRRRPGCTRTCGRSPRRSRCARGTAAALVPGRLPVLENALDARADVGPDLFPDLVGASAEHPVALDADAWADRRRCRKTSGPGPTASTSRSANRASRARSSSAIAATPCGAPSGVSGPVECAHSRAGSRRRPRRKSGGAVDARAVSLAVSRWVAISVSPCRRRAGRTGPTLRIPPGRL